MHPVLVFGGLYFVFQILAFVILELAWLGTSNLKAIIGGPFGLAAITGTWLLKQQRNKNTTKGGKGNESGKSSI